MGREREMGRDGYTSTTTSLFESRTAKGRLAYKLFAFSVFVGVCLILVYRATHIPGRGGEGRWPWMGLFAAELWFGLYWVLTQSIRWNPVYYHTFKERLSHSHRSNELPGVDIFVCTADTAIEPPALVINTVLSVMAFDYPPEKLSVYLSDDGGSELTFYALLEAAQFAKYWIPFCKKFKVEPRSPVAYFSSQSSHLSHLNHAKEMLAIKNLFKEMEKRIVSLVKLGKASEELRKQHKGFSEWGSGMKSDDHRAILQILIDGKDQNTVDTEGVALPTLVYLAREKRPQHHHNFKAGAMNALIRVSSEISNGEIILNVDCDMYSNNSETVRDALCFFMDEDKGRDIGFVQLPQNFNNITYNNIYGDAINVVNEVESPGFNGCGGPMYLGTGCFHRRDSLCGRKYGKDCSKGLDISRRNVEENTCTLEERAKGLASCAYEENTQWGKEMGLKYGCPVEDIITGLSIQCRGWKSIYFNPARKGFLGVAPITLEQMLVQHKRWSEGLFQIFLSKYCPFLYGYGKTNLAHQMGYSVYCLWAPCSLATLYYVIVPPLCLLKGISLFPKVSSPWFIPFAFVIVSEYIHSLHESLWSGESLSSWWNMQRSWMMRRTVSYLFGFIDAVLNSLGLTKSAFLVTAKVADQDVLKRYQKEIMEFGSPSPMFAVLATLAVLNLLCLAGGIKSVLVDGGVAVLERLSVQFILCGLLVAINIPIYRGLFFRRDKGRVPAFVTFESVVLAMAACLMTPIR